MIGEVRNEEGRETVPRTSEKNKDLKEVRELAGHIALLSLWVKTPGAAEAPGQECAQHLLRHLKWRGQFPVTVHCKEYIAARGQSGGKRVPQRGHLFQLDCSGAVLGLD